MAVGGEEQGENQEQVAVVDKSDIAYPVKLRGAVFGYFAHNLEPVYSRELAEVRKEGNFDAIGEFHKSKFGSLMTRILDKFNREPEAMPQSVELNISKNDVGLVLKKAKVPSGFGEAQIRREMEDDLKSGYRSAQLDAGAKVWASGLITELKGLAPKASSGKSKS